jgi:hypothetical protein
MLNTQTFNLVLIACSAIAGLSALVCILLMRRARTEARNCLAVVTELQTELSDTSRDMDTMTQRATSQERRIAWIESRVRNAKAVNLATDEETFSQPPAKLSVTEQRHRVAQLTNRGVDCNTIASMLDMPHGEVELMIGLSHLN